MKALTIHQPYAHLIAIGDKRVENRTRPTKHRGELAIHAGKSRNWLTDEYPIDEQDLVFGAVVAVAEIVECFYVSQIQHNYGKSEMYPWLQGHKHTLGPYCYVLGGVRPLTTPVYTRGYQSIFELTPDIEKAVREAIKQ